MLRPIAIATVLAIFGADQTETTQATREADTRARIRQALAAVRANAEAVSSYYIECEMRSYRSEDRPNLDSLPPEDTATFVTTFQWWRSGAFWAHRQTSRTLRSEPLQILERKRIVDEDGNEVIVETGRGGRARTMVEERFGLQDQVLFWRGAEVGGQARHHVVPSDMSFTERSDAWKTIPGGPIPDVLLPGGSGANSRFPTIEEAMEQGTASWRTGVKVLGHVCTVVEARTKEQTDADPDDPDTSQPEGATPEEFDVRVLHRVYLDTCCPGLIRGTDFVLQQTYASGETLVLELIERTYEARKLDGRVWVAWEVRSVSSSRGGRSPLVPSGYSLSVSRVTRCDFRPLRPDEPGIEIPAGTRVYSDDKDNHVYRQLKPIRLTAQNFKSWYNTVRRQLGPAEVVLGGAPAGITYADEPRPLNTFTYVASAIVLLIPLALLLAGYLWRRRAAARNGDKA